MDKRIFSPNARIESLFYQRLPQRIMRRVLRNEIDRYGFSDLLARKLNLKFTPRAFASWSHGWVPAEAETEEFNYASGVSQRRILVANQRLASILKEKGYEHVSAAGLPFAYVENLNVSRIPGSIIFFPPHSGERKLSNSDTQLMNYISYIESFSSLCSLVAICAFGDDFFELKKVLPKGITLVGGADPYDTYSLTRMRVIFQSFDFMSTNILGSHILYAAFSGCKISLTLPLYRVDLDAIRIEKPRANDEEWVERQAYFLSEEYLIKNYPQFICSDPLHAKSHPDWARVEIGGAHILDGDPLVEALGWHFSDQVAGYLRGAKRKLISLI